MKLSKLTFACVLAVSASAPQFAMADDSLEFHGYARWGTAYEQDGNKYVTADGQTGNATGRLGNEGNGGEWLFLKRFEPENGTKWDLGFMVEDWGELGTKQAWAGASNVFESQPNAYVWAGKVFHSRLQQGLTDYYLSINDGEGAGIKGLELGFANLELGFVNPGWNGDYAITSKLSNIKLGAETNLDIIANYGFSDDSDTGTDIDAYMVIAKVSQGGHNLYYRYSDNVENSLSWGRIEGWESHYVSVDGSFGVNDKTRVEYLAAYHSIDAPKTDASNGDRTNYNAVVRPTYAWNNIHSTWVEVGASIVDFDDDREDNTAYKVTLSQNISVDGVPWARPMLRFYATVGEEENQGVTENPVTVGAMFEAWW